MSKGVDNLLGYDDVISGSSTRNEAALIGTNEVREERFDAVDNDFSDGFVEDIAQAF